MWKVTLKDGREVRLRFTTIDDGERLFQMFASMSDEALKWSRAPYTMEVIMKMIKRWVANVPPSIALVAEFDDRIVGNAVISRFPNQTRKGIGDYAVHLHQDFHNVGLGTAITDRILLLAKNEKMHRIELSVAEENKSALYLYEKFGFHTEGLSKDAFYGYDDKYHNMVHMGLILKY